MCTYTSILAWARRVPSRFLIAALTVQATAAVGLMPTAAAQDTPVALTHVSVVDVERGTVQPDMTVLIRNKRIQSVKPFRTGDIPQGTRVENLQGKFVIPGLWDMHVHILMEGREWALAQMVKHGVTGVRELGGQFESVDSLRRAIAQGRIIGPRILASGPQIENADAFRGILADATVRGDTLALYRNRVLVENPAQAKRVVDSLVRLGVDMIKARNVPDVATYWAIANAARKANRPFVAHPLANIDPFALADSGQHSVEHWIYPNNLASMPQTTRDSLIALYARKGTAFVPTLRAWNQHRLTVDTLERALRAASADKRGGASRESLYRQWTTDLNSRRREVQGRPATAAELTGWARALDNLALEIGRLRSAGVIVLPGSDMPFATYPGAALLDELTALVVEAGFTPHQALYAATIASAKFVGLADSVGTIANGKTADLVILDDNPLIDIAHVRRVSSVMQQGHWVFRREATPPGKKLR